MFEQLEKRAAGVAEARALARGERVRERADAVPGVRAEVTGGDVVLSGRGLGRRMVTDAALRWVVEESRDER